MLKDLFKDGKKVLMFILTITIMGLAIYNIWYLIGLIFLVAVVSPSNRR